MIPINKLNPFRRFCMTIGELPTSYIESMSYAELVTWLCNYLQNTVIPTVNNNGEAVTELQNLFKELETFVVTYLESPEFIENIDNKLDEMAEDGTFDQIINTNITGRLMDLQTDTKTNLVSAINEVNTKTASNSSKIGDLSNLETTVKTDIVSAINEINEGTPKLNGLMTYSVTDEVEVGTWVSGETIYRKIIFITGFDEPDSYDVNDILIAQTDIENVENIINLKIIGHGDSNLNWYDITNYSWKDSNQSARSYINTQAFIDFDNDYKLSIAFHCDGATKPTFLILAYGIVEYTKQSNNS